MSPFLETEFILSNKLDAKSFAFPRVAICLFLSSLIHLFQEFSFLWLLLKFTLPRLYLSFLSAKFLAFPKASPKAFSFINLLFAQSKKKLFSLISVSSFL